MPALSKQFNFVINTGTFTATSVSIPSAAISINGDTLFNSTPEKGNGYFGSADGMHTVTYTVTNNFMGTATMQASLVTNPTELDWFLVDNTTKLYYNNTTSTAVRTDFVNFTGNFVWVRASIQRSADLTNGSVLFTNYNH